MRWRTVCESAWCSPRQSSAVTRQRCVRTANASRNWVSTHLLAYDHVVGADPAVHVGWAGPYDVHTTFHEPLVMFGYLAAVTTTLELVTGIIILPQRQAVLVAKQAAEVDLLSEGRLRLGVGLGWNSVEYEALGEDFTNRGRRLAEQVARDAAVVD